MSKNGELRKLFRVQYPSQNFKAIDNPRPGAREVSAGVDEMDLATLL